MEKRWSRKKRERQQTEEPLVSEVSENVPARNRTEQVSPVSEPAPSTRPKRVVPMGVRARDVEDPVEAPVEIPVIETRETAPEPVAAPEPIPEPIAPAPVAEPVAEPTPAPPSGWQQLGSFAINRKHLERNRIITAERTDPAHSAFDVLRTKLLRALRENGWTRVAVTSPTEGCGKTFMSVNLALSLSRQANCRTILMDMDMRRPNVAKVMGISDPGSMGDFLRGDEQAVDFLKRAGKNDLKIGDNIAVGVNGRREDYASELMQLPETAEALDRMEALLKPDIILFDMPPALVNDDVLAARPLFDGVLMIVGGGITKPQQVREVERRLGAETPLLGVVLNRSEGEGAQSYSY